MTTYTAIKSLKYYSSIPQCLQKNPKKQKIKNPPNPWQQAYKKKKRTELEERIRVFQIILWLT